MSVDGEVKKRIEKKNQKEVNSKQKISDHSHGVV